MFADNSSVTDSFVEVNFPDMQTQTDQNVMTEHKQLLEMMERTAKMADVKLKIQPLKGADEWPEFKFRLEVFSSTMGFEDEMKYAETPVSGSGESIESGAEGIQQDSLQYLTTECWSCIWPTSYPTKR